MGRSASSNVELAKRLTLVSDASSMYAHTALFNDLLQSQFESPRDYGLDVLWDGTSLRWQWADLHAGESRHAPLLYELEALDREATNFWQRENRMVGEVNYLQLFQWIRDHVALWQDHVSTVYVYVDNRPLADPNHCPDFWSKFCLWLLARCSYLCPYQEVTTAVHVPR